MNNVKKNNLLQQISDAIKEAEKLKQNSNFSGIYDTAVCLLKNMKNAVNTDYNLTKKELKTRATSLGMFSVKELDIYDDDFSTKLCKLASAYEQYYSLTDPDIEKLLGNN